MKSSNILLTESYRAKVSDFGFAKSGPTDADQTHISTKVKGTAGYLDPEYLRTYQLTPKSDVFSFGILLIEIISGRRPVDLKRNADERITVRWVSSSLFFLKIWLTETSSCCSSFLYFFKVSFGNSSFLGCAFELKDPKVCHLTA